jgi:hypothetical protein
LYYLSTRYIGSILLKKGYFEYFDTANQTGEEDIQTGDIDLLDLATRKLTTPGVQSNPDEAIEKAKQQYR